MSRRFRLDNVWRAALPELGLSQAAVLRRAGLPLDLLSRPDPMVDSDEYYRLVDAVDAEAASPDLGLRLGQMLSVDVFDPSLFAAACSPSLDIAVARVATYKQLMGPFRLDVDDSLGGLRVVFECVDRPSIPSLLGLVDVTFSVHWIRHATGVRVIPTEVGLPELPEDLAPYERYFGVVPVARGHFSLAFSDADTKRPFLTANPGMWRSFEPELRRRLAELEVGASWRERVAAALLELLPSGRSHKTDVARALGLGDRTLQRRLHEEGTSFQAVLATTRESLARHYLRRADITQTEVAYLLGFDDSNSFSRAFRQWTGTTPDAVRRADPARSKN